jgi:phage shock protein B
VEDTVIPLVGILSVFVGLPWIILHYMSQWRRAKGISIEDENLLDDLHDTARRLDARLDSIERIIAADNPGWREGLLPRTADRTADRAPGAEPRLAARR